MVSVLAPSVSVIIPTFNWSAALGCAVRSALLQTMQDFEILVVGDGCTDDSERVIRDFGDRRISWHNLDRNHGSQWAANNYGLEAARSDIVAYLGHDDIWYPTHLEAVLRAARTHGAQIVTSIMAMYGPPGSGCCGIAGVFATGAYASRDFVPPSAFAHSKSLCTEDNRWQSPDRHGLPIDVLFINGLIAGGGTLASTGELTCFKFNAAWRRDIYKTKTVAEQERMLAQVESGVDFRQAELLGIVQAALAGRMITVSAPLPNNQPGFIADLNRRYKGAKSRFAESELVMVTRSMRFNMRNQDMPFEWHRLERRRFGRSFRWTGPCPNATIDLPIRFDRNLGIRIGLRPPLKPEVIDTLTISVHDKPVAHRVTKRGRRRIEIEAKIFRDAVEASNRDFGVTLHVGEMIRPCDVSRSSDTRTVGVPVSWIEVRPL